VLFIPSWILTFSLRLQVLDLICLGSITHFTYLYGPDCPDIEDLTISREGVEKRLSNLNIAKASGPDSIPCRFFLKELSFEIAPILSAIFQQSLKDGVVASDWKNADVAPAFKKGGRNLAENYCPISLKCVCCKILEHIISSHIRHHLDNYKIISSFPHGFYHAMLCIERLLPAYGVRHVRELRQKE